MFSIVDRIDFGSIASSSFLLVLLLLPLVSIEEGKTSVGGVKEREQRQKN